MVLPDTNIHIFTHTHSTQILTFSGTNEARWTVDTPHSGNFFVDLECSSQKLPGTDLLKYTVPNDPPSVQPVDRLEVDEDGVVEAKFFGDDTEDQGLIFVITNLPASGSLFFKSNQTWIAIASAPTPIHENTIRYSPTPDSCGFETSFNFLANDGYDDSAEETVQISVNCVNDGPSISPLPALTSGFSVISGSEVCISGPLATFADIDSDLLTSSVQFQASDGSVVKLAMSFADKTTSIRFIDDTSFLARYCEDSGPAATVTHQVFTDVLQLLPETTSVILTRPNLGAIRHFAQTRTYAHHITAAVLKLHVISGCLEWADHPVTLHKIAESWNPDNVTCSSRSDPDGSGGSDGPDVWTDGTLSEAAAEWPVLATAIPRIDATGLCWLEFNVTDDVITSITAGPTMGLVTNHFGYAFFAATGINASEPLVFSQSESDIWSRPGVSVNYVGRQTAFSDITTRTFGPAAASSPSLNHDYTCITTSAAPDAVINVTVSISDGEYSAETSGAITILSALVLPPAPIWPNFTASVKEAEKPIECATGCLTTMPGDGICQVGGGVSIPVLFFFCFFLNFDFLLRNNPDKSRHSSCTSLTSLLSTMYIIISCVCRVIMQIIG